ncbi:MAG: hypothetical protein V1875_03175 [Candidatus Altiarchaeota archaeon]
MATPKHLTPAERAARLAQAQRMIDAEARRRLVAIERLGSDQAKALELISLHDTERAVFDSLSHQMTPEQQDRLAPVFDSIKHPPHSPEAAETADRVRGLLKNLPSVSGTHTGESVSSAGAPSRPVVVPVEPAEAPGPGITVPPIVPISSSGDATSGGGGAPVVSDSNASRVDVIPEHITWHNYNPSRGSALTRIFPSAVEDVIGAAKSTGAGEPDAVALTQLASGLRNVLIRRKQKEAEHAGGPSTPVTVADREVSNLMFDLISNTALDISEVKGARTMVDLFDKLTEAESGYGRKQAEQRDHDGSNVVTVADALALQRRFLFEGDTKNAKLLSDAIGRAVISKMKSGGYLTAYGLVGHTYNIGDENALKRDGVIFDSATTQALGSKVHAEVAVQLHTYYLFHDKSTKVKRLPFRALAPNGPAERPPVAGSLRDMETADNEAIEELKRKSQPHPNDPSLEVERTDYEVEMARTFSEIMKHALGADVEIHGATAPDWYFRLTKFLISELFMDLREIQTEKATFDQDNPKMREIEKKIRARLARGDLKMDGLLTLDEAMESHVRTTMGSQTVRGFSHTVGAVWGAVAIDDGAFATSLLDKVNEGRRARPAVDRNRDMRPETLTHADQIQASDLDWTVVGGICTVEGIADLDTLTKRLAKTRVMSDIYRGVTRYFDLTLKHSQLSQTLEHDLRMKKLFQKPSEIDTSTQEIFRYDIERLSVAQPGELKYMGDDATPEEAARIQKYLRAFIGSPPPYQDLDTIRLVQAALTSTQWQNIRADEASGKLKGKAYDDFILGLSNINSEEKKRLTEYLKLLTNDPTPDGNAFFAALVNIEDHFMKTFGRTVNDALRRCRERVDLTDETMATDQQKAEVVGYRKQKVTEWLRDASDNLFPEEHETMQASVQLTRLMSKYGDRLNGLRTSLGNPYTPIGYALIFSEDERVKPEREKILRELQADLFNPNGTFTGLGTSIAGHSDIDKVNTLSPEQQKQKTLWLYIYLQEYAARYQGDGELARRTMDYGEQYVPLYGIQAGDMVSFITRRKTDPAEQKLQVRRVDKKEITDKLAISAGRLGGGKPYKNVLLVEGITVIDAWPQEQLAIDQLVQDPVVRTFWMNLAANQHASNMIIDKKKAAGKVTIKDACEILATAGVEDTNSALTELPEVREYSALLKKPVALRTAADNLRMTALEGIVLTDDQLENFHDMKAGALRSTARFLQLEPGANLGNLEKFIIQYSDGVLNRYDRKFAEADLQFKGAYEIADSIKQLPGRDPDKDVRVLALNARGMTVTQEAEYYERKLEESEKKKTQSAADLARNQACRQLAKARYARAMELYSASLLISLDKEKDLALTLMEDKPLVQLDSNVFSRITHWWNTRFRFKRIYQAAKKVENPGSAEAKSGLARVNAKYSRYAAVAGDGTIRTTIQGALGTGFVGAAVATVSAVGATVAAASGFGVVGSVLLGTAAVAGVVGTGGIALGLAALAPALLFDRRSLGVFWGEEAREQKKRYTNVRYQPDVKNKFLEGDEWYFDAELTRHAGNAAGLAYLHRADRSWIGFLRSSPLTYMLGTTYIEDYKQAAMAEDDLIGNLLMHVSTAGSMDDEHRYFMRDFHHDTWEIRHAKRASLTTWKGYNVGYSGMRRYVIQQEPRFWAPAVFGKSLEVLTREIAAETDGKTKDDLDAEAAALALAGDYDDLALFMKKRALLDGMLVKNGKNTGIDSIIDYDEATKTYHGLRRPAALKAHLEERWGQGEDVIDAVDTANRSVNVKGNAWSWVLAPLDILYRNGTLTRLEAIMRERKKVSNELGASVDTRSYGCWRKTKRMGMAAERVKQYSLKRMVSFQEQMDPLNEYILRLQIGETVLQLRDETDEATPAGQDLKLISSKIARADKAFIYLSSAA